MPEGEYRFTMKNMPADLRPRERLRKVGAGSLSTAELLAIILRTGTKDETVLDLAHRILMDPRGLRFLAEAGLDELCEIKGWDWLKLLKLKQLWNWEGGLPVWIWS